MHLAYEYHLIVTYEETNALGNVYYVNYLRWQGKVREMFLFEHAPDVLKELGRDFLMVTKSVECDYDQELRAFDRIVIRMRLARRGETFLRLLFDYFRVSETGEERIARGAQELASLDIQGQRPRPLPIALVEALKPFEVEMTEL